MSANENVMKKEKAGLFAMVLNSPGMTETRKLSMKLSRRNILLLSRLIEAGFLTGNESLSDDILKGVNEEAKSEFKVLQEELLKKSDLTEFYERLKQL